MPPDPDPSPWNPVVPDENRAGVESVLRSQFRSWLADLDPAQLAALAHNWENVMEDAAQDRVDSWVIAGKAITELRSNPAGERSEP